ncbi:MAG: hypothetical protein ACOYMG_14780 [Candidatus Methylumidiphilus sp.]
MNDKAMSPSTSNASNANNAREYPLSHHVYGGKAASCWSHDQTKGECHTIAIETAPAIRAREYDWSAKTRIQATRGELVAIAAVLAGFLPQCRFESHGEGKDKGFSLERQAKGIFLRTWRKGAAHAMPISFEDGYYLGNMILCQLRRNQPWMDSMSILAQLRTFAKSVTATAPAAQQ